MALTTVADLDSSGTLAYELGHRYALRPELQFASAKVRRTKASPVSHSGGSERFSFFSDHPANVTPLTETGDVTPRILADSNVDVSLVEYGDVTGMTRKMKGTGFLMYDQAAAEINGRQAADSFEILARTALEAGTNVSYAGAATSTATIAATHILAAAQVKQAVARMRNRSVRAIAGTGNYLCFVSPDQSYDLREETGDAAWVTSQNYQDKLNIENGVIGSFGGALFVETPRVQIVTDGGVTTTDTYNAIMIGDEALACAYSKSESQEMPGVEISPMVDKLNRFFHIGWYWLGGFKILRDEAVERLETASSIGANS